MIDFPDDLPCTPARPCPYLDDRLAREQGFAADSLPADLYGLLLDRGFRRSGIFFYRPRCDSCDACVPIRIPVADFRPSRSQRRVRRRNRDLRQTVRAAEPPVDDAVFAVYCRYLDYQHPGSPQSASLEELEAFLYEPTVDSLEIRYELEHEIVGVSIVDVLPRESAPPGQTPYMSSVYHFFNPEFAGRSPGVYSVLAEVDRCRQGRIPYYYLGYWVGGARTMEYKTAYRPHEFLRNGVWTALNSPRA